MKKSLLFTYGLLIALTLFTALISKSAFFSGSVILLILFFSAIKFLLVAFQFMELNKANPFWKFSLSLVLGVLVLVLFLIK
ncbi:cytochrome C oxidase subunit IV family protein [Flavobacterium commune]|uniref:cytochrome C oxidase subunit IV family protein n=1 Tax=Flavobacterium commune TaxID=1306519 RepID=UPI0012FA5C8D|nr:cytochrome C oxidase subunit IV family protein [Flavobacterium commune]